MLATVSSVLHGLAVDDHQGRLFMTPFLNPDLFAKGLVDGVELTGTLEVVKIMLDGTLRRKIVRKHFPLAAGFELIENAVGDFTQDDGFGPPAFRELQERLKQIPLLERRGVYLISQKSRNVNFPDSSNYRLPS